MHSKAAFKHQTWAPTELINDNTVTLMRFYDMFINNETYKTYRAF